MTVTRCRIDDRLLHAEVLYGELETGAFDRLVLASRLEWADSADLSLIPPGVSAVRVAPAEAAEQANEGATLVVLGTLLDLAEAVEAGLAPDLAVLANRARRSETRRLSETYWADEPEIALLRGFLSRGVRFVLQRVPTEPVRELDETLFDPAETDDLHPNQAAHDAAD